MKKLIFTLTAMSYCLLSMAQSVDILGDAKITGQVEVMDTIIFSDGTQLASACLAALNDADNDTGIEVEKVPDEDLIRFKIKGVEVATLSNGQFTLKAPGFSTFIGDGAGGNDDGTNNYSVAFGYNAGQMQTNGFGNTYIGTSSGAANINGNDNTYLGVSAGYQNTMSGNTMLGRRAGFNNVTGANNTLIGNHAGRNNTAGSGNVYLGNFAGENHTGSNLLVIDNSNTPNPLLFGNFSTNFLRVGGKLSINGVYEFPELAGAAGQVMSYDGNGKVVWTNPGGAAPTISDTDGDTQIQFEESPDEDIIRFDVAGQENMFLDIQHLHLTNGANSVHIGENAGTQTTTGVRNVLIGSNAGRFLQAGINNTAIGHGAGDGMNGSENNTYVGYRAGSDGGTSEMNTFLGASAGNAGNPDDENTFVGYSSGGESDGEENTFLGVSTGFVNSGDGNTYLGYQAGNDINNGNFNVFLGYRAGVGQSGSHKLIIDNDAHSTPLIQGDFADQEVEVNGDFSTIGHEIKVSDLGTGDTNKGIKFQQGSGDNYGIVYESAQGFIPSKLHFRKYLLGQPNDIMTLTYQDNVGIGTEDPTHRLEVRGSSPVGHIMKIENTSSTNQADGLEIALGIAQTTAHNNYVTFKDGDGIAGRIEGFSLGDFVAPPPIDFSLYYNPLSIESAFDKGALPTINWNTLVWPTINEGMWPNFDPGDAGTISVDADFDVGQFISNVGCVSNPICNIYPSFYDFDIDVIGFEEPSLSGGSWPTINPGSPPSWNQGALPSLDLDIIVDPTPVVNAWANLKDMMCWALEFGERNLVTTNPWDIEMLKSSQFLSNLAECKNGGVTYGSGGADYAEYLERENREEAIQEGQIVGVRGGRISLKTEGAEQLLVISMMPIVLGNQPADTADIKNFEKVAFLGQAPVWVVGEVSSGDYIIPSGNNDGLGLAVTPKKLTLEHLPLVIGRAWSDADQPLNLVNMALGIKTNEMATIMGQFHEDIRSLEDRVSSIEAMIEGQSSVSQR